MSTTTVMLVPLTTNNFVGASFDNSISVVAAKLADAINDCGCSQDVIAAILPALELSKIESLLSQGKVDELLEDAVAIRENYKCKNGKSKSDSGSGNSNDSQIDDGNNDKSSEEILLFQGLSLTSSAPYAAELNYKLAVALDAMIIFVLHDRDGLINVDIPGNKRASLERKQAQDKLVQQCKIMLHPHVQHRRARLLGYVVVCDDVNANDATNKETVIGDKAKNGNLFGIADLLMIGFVPIGKSEGCSPSANKRRVNDSVSKTKNNCSKYLPTAWVENFIARRKEQHKNDGFAITPALFCHRLIGAARVANQCVVLPEGSEPRTLQAANICAERGVARCILLGDPDKIRAEAHKLGITLHDALTIVDSTAIADKYVEPLYEIRRHKGVTLDEVRAMLKDSIVVGTMMLQRGEVDGLVSGAVHTTAHTIRPAFQIIKTAPDAKIISSIFFVCLPEQVLAYSDCAVNINPTAIELADIAIQSANSAQRFGIKPRVALLSYSTGTSGVGADVERVKEAVAIVRQKRPDLAAFTDGPLQYDAAIDLDVARLKAPQSLVAGKANVFIFPDLNSGNIGYKAVQRATGAVCIGPMLQGMRKPVNDLSRGCLVEDIVFTIALTAVQAQ